MTTLIFALAAMLGLPMQDQSPVPEPSGQIDLSAYECRTYLALVEAEDGRSDVHTVWAHGYYSALQGVDETSTEPLTFETIIQFARRLQQTCRDEPAKLFVVAVKEVTGR